MAKAAAAAPRRQTAARALLRAMVQQRYRIGGRVLFTSEAACASAGLQTCSLSGSASLRSCRCPAVAIRFTAPDVYRRGRRRDAVSRCCSQPRPAAKAWHCSHSPCGSIKCHKYCARSDMHHLFSKILYSSLLLPAKDSACQIHINELRLGRCKTIHRAKPRESIRSRSGL